MASAERGAGAVDAGPLLEVPGEGLLLGLRSGLRWLEANQEQINELNVFPVPDGDTGSNMYLTMRAAVEEAERSREPASAASVMSAAAHGSLMGARGNSGVILSQIFRGFAQGLENRTAMDASSTAHALDNAAKVAYRAVMKPTEGTILTVAREAARAATAAAEGTDDVRAVLARAVAGGHDAVGRTMTQLAVLREAGVVDAGGFGLAVILEGLADALAAGERTGPRAVGRAGAPRVLAPGSAERPGPSPGRRGAAAAAAGEGGFGFCTEFLISGPGLDLEALRDELGGLGESALVVGDADVVRVHIHTADPQALIAVASERGPLSRLKIDDMSEQHHDVVERGGAGPAPPASASAAVVTPAAGAGSSALAVVSVAPSTGFREILTSLGADRVVEGGPTMNPSTQDLLRAVQATGARSVLVLPNNGNVILTAEQVDALAEGIEVVVVPTRNLPQGISALLAVDREAGVESNLRRLNAALERVRAVEVTRAVRDASANGLAIRAGDVIALIDGEITQAGEDAGAVIRAVLRNVEDPPELVTVYRGADVGEAEARTLIEALRADHPGVDFELHDGGQTHYPYVLSLE